MEKKIIIKKLQDMGKLATFWRLKDFMIMENDDIIKFSYNHGDMGIVDKIIYNKHTGETRTYTLNNYYGSVDLCNIVYL